MTLKSKQKIVGFRPTEEGRKEFAKWFKSHKEKNPWATRDMVLCEMYYNIFRGRIKFPWEVNKN